MTIRNILVIMTGADQDRGAGATAFLAADRFTTHVEGLHVRPDLVHSLPYISEGMSQSAITHEMQSATNRLEEAEQNSKEHFETAREAVGASFADVPTMDGSVTASWHVEVGRVQELAGQRGRVFDLTVVS